MAQLVIEGTWEEILAQQEKLQGKRVRVTVLEEAQAEIPAEGRNLLDFLQPFVGCLDSEQLPPGRDIEKAVEEIIWEKHKHRRKD